MLKGIRFLLGQMPTIRISADRFVSLNARVWHRQYCQLSTNADWYLITLMARNKRLDKAGFSVRKTRRYGGSRDIEELGTGSNRSRNNGVEALAS